MLSMNPDVTVVVPTRNRLRLLPFTVSSLLQQRDVLLELVVVDDGSTDGAEQWLSSLANKEPRLRVIRNPESRGVSAARNSGIAHALGRWIAFCDDDDLWAPGKLSAQLDAMTRQGVSWSCTSEVFVDEKLKIVGHKRLKGGDILRDLLSHNAVPGGGSAVVVEGSLLHEVGGFDETMAASEDWEMWVRVARRSSIAGVDEPLVAHRLTQGSASTNVDAMRRGRTIVLSRFEALAQEMQVSDDGADYERYLAKQLLRAGNGRQAAAIYAHLLLKHKRWQDVPRIAMALLAPKAADAIGSARYARGVPSDWRADAERWLREVMANQMFAPAGVQD